MKTWTTAKTKTTMRTISQERSASLLFGLWCIDHSRLQAYVDAAMIAGPSQVLEIDADEKPRKTELFERAGDIAIIEMRGPSTKHEHSFMGATGGFATVNVRRAVRAAASDESIAGIMLVIDSPGGSVSGNGDLADDIREAASAKPVHAYIEDCGCSAAYWLASQADKITASRNAQYIGNIGTITTLIDSSEQAKAEGIKVHVVAVGKHKPIGQPGAPVTKEHLAETQREVNVINDMFVNAVAEGRGLSAKTILGFEARAFAASEALGNGLIDAVGTAGDAFDSLQQDIQAMADQEKHEKELEAAYKRGEEAGYAKGAEEQRDHEIARCQALADKFPDDPGFVLAQFTKGNDLARAKGDYSDVLEAKLKASQEALKKLEQRDGDEGVSFADAEKVDADSEPSKPADPYAGKSGIDRWQAEWDDDHDDCKAKYKSFYAYAAYRRSVDK